MAVSARPPLDLLDGEYYVLEIEKNKQVFISSDQDKGGYRPAG